MTAEDRLPAPHVLREYALLADGERGVIVGPRGELVWMCFPRWDSDAIFSALLGGPGVYAITPRARCVWGGYYDPGSLIWNSRWIGGDTIIECREALALPSRPDRAMILRRVIARHGTARLHVTLDPRAGYGHHTLTHLARADDGAWIGRCGDSHLRWTGAPDATPAERRSDPALTRTLELPEGAHHDFVLQLTTAEPDDAPPDPDRAWQGTEAAWRERVPHLEATIAQRDARHAYAVLSGLTSDGGGMVAAATTSLPERARQGRNYDYRYVWVRDQCYTGQAVAAAGPHSLMDDAVHFVGERLLADGPQLNPAYTITGGPVADQRRLDLPGYPGATAIAGNWVNRQFQLDAFGEALLLFAAAARHDHLEPDTWRAAATAADAIEQRWQEPDAGIWEIDPDHWTHSRLICVAGLRQISRHGARGEQTARWLSLADTIGADTATHALHGSGRWQRSPTDPRPDAALLLPAIRGAVPAADPRTLATLQAIGAELADDGYCYRYQPDERPLGRSEGAFLLCGLWMALAHHQQGDALAAAHWFERNRAACGPPGLLSEEFDVTQRQLRGNLPQAFVHALLLECASTL
ncbi:MAG TPA: glycoside hydrolase family 15 protein, partial [Solirubrobacteraceae bacterium]